MIQIRKSSERGHFDHGWLDTYHTFSFADYHDRKHMGFRALRVINEDRVQPGQGFGTHGHRDMEILTYVLDGALEHRDSMGNGSVIEPGDVQYMSAGSGVEHSEFNHRKDREVHLIQIWILPDARDLAPRYDQKKFADKELHGKLRLVASKDGRDGSIQIRQDADLYAARLEKDLPLRFTARPGRHFWLQVVRGEVDLNGQRLGTGDGAALDNERELVLQATSSRGEILLFDLG